MLVSIYNGHNNWPETPTCSFQFNVITSANKVLHFKIDWQALLISAVCGRFWLTFYSASTLLVGLLVIVNQFHIFMLTPIHPSLLHFPHPSLPHSFTLNSKLTFLVNLFRHRSLTIDISDWLPRLMGPFSVFTVFVGVISCFWCGRQN